MLNLRHKMENIMTRIGFRLLNTLAFVIPPVGLLMYFAYKNENPSQSNWFLLWAGIGTLFYLGVI